MPLLYNAVSLNRFLPVSIVYFRYKFDTEFERELKREVFKIVRRGQEFGTPGYFFRAICYICFFFYMQYQWIQGTSYTLALVYGVAMALIGLNVQHDANHGAASRDHQWINTLLGFGADFIGGCKYLWMEKHWTVSILMNEFDCPMVITYLASCSPQISFHGDNFHFSTMPLPITKTRTLMGLAPNPSFYSIIIRSTIPNVANGIRIRHSISF